MTMTMMIMITFLHVLKWCVCHPLVIVRHNVDQDLFTTVTVINDHILSYCHHHHHHHHYRHHHRYHHHYHSSSQKVGNGAGCVSLSEKQFIICWPTCLPHHHHHHHHHHHRYHHYHNYRDSGYSPTWPMWIEMHSLILLAAALLPWEQSLSWLVDLVTK